MATSETWTGSKWKALAPEGGGQVSLKAAVKGWGRAKACMVSQRQDRVSVISQVNSYKIWFNGQKSKVSLPLFGKGEM